MSVRIQLFGAPRITRDEAVVTFDTRKATALLAYLAVTGIPHRRDSLAALLWPEAPAAKARATLRRTLSVAAAVGPGLRSTGAEVSLDGAECDVTVFQTLAGSADPADLHRAASLAEQPFMAGFSLRDSPDFDDWQVAVADGLRDRLTRVLEQLMAVLAASGDIAGALDHARRRVALDPMSEPANRDLMIALVRSGDRAASLRQYRALLRILDRELGVAPLPETTELAAAIRSGDLPPWPQPVGEPHVQRSPGEGPVSPATPDLVGRGVLLGRLTAAVDGSARAAEGLAIGITGEPGMGRTAVLGEVARAAADSGANVLFATCREHDGALPLGLAGDLLAPLLLSIGSAEADDALAGLHPALPIGEVSPGAQRRRVDAVRSLLADRAAASPIVLLIDDAHLADTSSAALLGHLVHRMPPRVSLVATWPSGGAAAELPRHIGASPAARVERLTGLTTEDVAVMAGPADAERLWEVTHGVPRHIVECLAAEDDRDGDLAGLIANRVDRASAAAQQVLAAAVVLEGPASAGLLRAVAGREEVEAVEAVEECVGRGLLIETGSGYQLPHEVARTVVAGRTSLARRQLLHRRAASALATSGEAAPALVARHYREGGELEASESWYWRAAQAAMRIRVDHEALQCLTQAGGAPEVMLAMGEVRVRLGQYDEAIAGYETALAHPEMSPAQRVTAHHRMALVHDRLGEYPAAADHLRVAVGLLEPADPRRGQLLADQALVCHRLGEGPKAASLAQQALGVPNADGDAGAPRAHNALGLVALSKGRADEALRHFDRATVAAVTLQQVEVQVAAGQNASRALQVLGRLDEALAIAQQTLTLAEKESDVHRVAAVTSQVADLLNATGEKAAARQLQTRATQLLAGVALPSQRPAVWLTAEW